MFILFSWVFHPLFGLLKPKKASEMSKLQLPGNPILLSNCLKLTQLPWCALEHARSCFWTALYCFTLTSFLLSYFARARTWLSPASRRCSVVCATSPEQFSKKSAWNEKFKAFANLYLKALVSRHSNCLWLSMNIFWPQKNTNDKVLQHHSSSSYFLIFFS